VAEILSIRDEIQMHKILVINPGSTSTKIACFIGKKKIQHTIRHDPTEIAGFNKLWDQFEYRLDAIKSFVKEHRITKLDAVVGRGGLLKPLKRGTYKVDENMLVDARKGVQGEHVSNLGCELAFEISTPFSCPAFVVDPVSVDEFSPLARFSGHPLIERKSLSHALNLRAAAIWASNKLEKDIYDVNFVVGHLGGGISIAAVERGKVVDANDASSDGPFSPERTGGLPLQPLIKLCYSEEYSQNKVRKLVMGEGGLKAHLGTSDLKEIEKRIENGDEKAAIIFEAMAYQIAKEIGSMATVLNGKIDAIVLTGGLANSIKLVNEIKKRVEFIAPIVIFAGELEMEAMRDGALRVLTGAEKAKTY
jgi:butyrate kinase